MSASRRLETPSESQTRPLKEMTRIGVKSTEALKNGAKSTGAIAFAASAPRTAARPLRRHPESPAIHSAARCNGAIGPAARKRRWDGSSVMLRPGRCRRHAAYAQPLHAPGIGVEHLEFEPSGMLHHLAAAWHAARERADETTQALDALLLFRRQERCRHALL